MKKIYHFIAQRGILLCIISLALIAGCIISEFDEYKIVLNNDGKSGIIYIAKYNIQSDQKDPGKQQEDFDNLIHNWKSDEYLLDKMNNGIYVKSRKLFIERGRLVWKEKAIFSDIYKLFQNNICHDTLRICLSKDETVTSTNGILIKTRDSTIVQWPLSMKKFVLKTQKNNFITNSDFVKKFERYLHLKKRLRQIGE